MAEHAHGEVGEKLDHPGLLEEGAEQDEEENIGRRDIGRRAVEAFGAERQLVDDLIEAIAAMGEVARQVFAEQAVGEEDRADGRQCDTHHPAPGLEHQHDQDDADDHVGAGQVTRALNQVALEIPLIESRRHAGQAEQPGQRLPGAAIAFRRVAEKHHQQQEADVARA